MKRLGVIRAALASSIVALTFTAAGWYAVVRVTRQFNALAEQIERLVEIIDEGHRWTEEENAARWLEFSKLNPDLNIPYAWWSK